MAQNSQPSIYQLMMGLEAPSIAQYQEQFATAEAGLGTLPASTGVANAMLGNQTNLQSEQLGIQGTQNTLAEQNAAQQYGISTAQNQLSGTENTEQRQNTLGTLGLEQSLLGTQEQLAGGEQGLAQSALATQQGQLDYNLPIQQRQQAGAAAASGASNTVGNTTAQGQIQEQFGVASSLLKNQSQQSALQYQGQQAGFKEQAGEYGIQNTEANQQYQNTAQGLALTQQGQTEAEQNQQAQMAQTAQSLGISQQQLQQQLQSGLYQNGLTEQSQQDQFLQSASTAAAGESQGYGAVLSNIGASTGLGANAFASAYPNLYG